MNSLTFSKDAEMDVVRIVRKPDFMIIGAGKSATTTVQAYLLRHPDVFMTSPKEPEFFADSTIWAKGFDWYEALYENAAEGALCGEASTTYSRWPHSLDSAYLIHRHTVAKKFVYIMRHPVDRAYSHYCHRMRSGVTNSFEEALLADEVYFDTGLYIKQIKRFLAYYPKECFLFLFTDDLKENPDNEMRKVQGFLELEYVDLIGPQQIAKNAKNEGHYLRYHTIGKYRDLPIVSKLVDWLPSSWKKSGFDFVNNSIIGRKVAENNAVPELKAETRQKLINRYRPFNIELSEFLGKDLANWEK